jgi:CubicO group peptidase (beta-lactamase class C family)
MRAVLAMLLSTSRGLHLAIAMATMASPVLAGVDLPPARFEDPDRVQKLVQALPQIEVMMRDRMTEMHIPGLSYGVIIDGELVMNRGIGVRDVASGAPVDADTVFRIASMSKSFTGLAILKLRDMGKLSLDDPVERYVPELRAWQPPTQDAGPITIRQLLSHTGGLPEDNPFGDRLLDLSPGDFSVWLSNGVPFSNAPGTTFEYSNLGFMLLGKVVTQASGRPFQVFISDEIFKPLGMNSTYWSPSAVRKEHLAYGYRWNKDSWSLEPMLEDGVGGAMGGVMTTPRDLSRFIAMMLAAYPPRDDAERAPALRRTLREMQSGLGPPGISVSRPIPGGALIGRAREYGFGLLVIEDCAWGREIQHSGGLPGFGSHMRWLPDRGVGVVVMANLTYAGTWQLARQAVQLLDSTGALKPRAAVASPNLIRAANAVTDLILDWSDEHAGAIAAANLFLDQPMEERRNELASLRSGLGACKQGGIKPENALRGSYRIDCEHGWLDVSLTLAPTQPVRVQHLDVSAGRPASPAFLPFASAVTRAIATGPAELRLAPAMKRVELAFALESARLSHGSCRLGDQISGDGVSHGKFKLACDQGGLELDLAVENGQLSLAQLSDSADAVCTP